MSKLPDFTAHGYQVIRILGHNATGGRVVTLANQLSSIPFHSNNGGGKQVVIKQFHFARAVNWLGFKAVEREMQVLGGLNHPGIPHYLGSFETEDGFCIVQEYKNAQPLSVARSFDVDEVKGIAIKILEILVYLQSRIPIIIHRDIKPENILVDEQLNVYLIDFGFARLGGGEVALSSVAAGTFGFMAPEQLYNRTLTEATDLYGLGATLICLLTNTKSTAIDKLIDEDGKIGFRHLLPKLSDRFIGWLEKLVAPKLKNRFDCAKTALEELTSLYLVRLPVVLLSQSTLEFTANRIGETVTQTVVITNSTPETILQGKWEVVPHLNDPPHTPDSHAWISFAPDQFQGNQVECNMTVDTSHLMAEKNYQRQILLHTNATPEIYPLTIQVTTASLPITKTRKSLYLQSCLAFSYYLIAGWIVAVLGSVTLAGLIAGDFVKSIITLPALAGTLGGFILGTLAPKLLPSEQRFVAGGIAGSGLGFLVGSVAGGWAMVAAGFAKGALAGMVAGFGVGIVAGIVGGALGGAGLEALAKVTTVIRSMAFSRRVAWWVAILMATAGMTWGVSLHLGLLNPYVGLALAATHIPISVMFLYLPVNHRRLMAAYRQREQHLIKP
jgi:serine/threonine protein kinase